MESSTYTKHKTVIEASGGLQIGPFTFGTKGGSTNIQVNTTGNKTSLSNVSTSDDPLIIGMVVAFPGVGN